MAAARAVDCRNQVSVRNAFLHDGKGFMLRVDLVEKPGKALCCRGGIQRFHPFQFSWRRWLVKKRAGVEGLELLSFRVLIDWRVYLVNRLSCASFVLLKRASRSSHCGKVAFRLTSTYVQAFF